MYPTFLLTSSLDKSKTLRQALNYKFLDLFKQISTVVGIDEDTGKYCLFSSCG